MGRAMKEILTAIRQQGDLEKPILILQIFPISGYQRTDFRTVKVFWNTI